MLSQTAENSHLLLACFIRLLSPILRTVFSFSKARRRDKKKREK